MRRGGCRNETLLSSLQVFYPFLLPSFYSARKHEKTQESAERLLELIADGNISDIGESDEDATCELTEPAVRAELTDVLEKALDTCTTSARDSHATDSYD